MPHLLMPQHLRQHYFSNIDSPFYQTVLRWWLSSSEYIESQFNTRGDHLRGVYDRRGNIRFMFAARILSAFLAFTAIVYLLSFSASQPRTPLSSTTPSERESLADSVLLEGTYRSASDDTRLIFQHPPHNEAKGTVIFLHGCRHSAFDFFPRSDACTECVGLPEELRMVRQVLHRGLTAMAVSSTSGNCWQTNEKSPTGDDYTRIATALDMAKEEHIYDDTKPLFAVGISSGGRFATSLTPRFPISGVNSIISPSVVSHRGDEIPPPHVFTHMHLRDDRTVSMISRDMAEFRTRNVPVEEFRVPPRAVTVSYLQTAIPSLSATLARDVLTALSEKGYLGADGHVLSNPRSSAWRSALDHIKDRLGDSLIADQSPLSEELNRAYAGHEITSDYFSDVLDFLIANKDSKASSP